MLYPIVAVETRLFAKPLLSNCCFVFAYLVVVAQQRVYMPYLFNIYMKQNVSRFKSYQMVVEFTAKQDTNFNTDTNLI
jgi:hypothetical protein